VRALVNRESHNNEGILYGVGNYQLPKEALYNGVGLN